MTQFELFPTVAAPSLTHSLAEFDSLGTPTIVEKKNGITYYINEFWTARQRQANRIHEISYRACFKPQLPAFFIERLTKEGDVVYDPFMGRGTTPLEAALQKRIPFGNDVNPLSRTLVEPRIDPPKMTEIQARLFEIPWEKFNRYEHAELLAFYHPETLSKIEGLRDWFLNKERDGSLDRVDRWIRMVAINRLTGHSSGFFSVYTLPPNQAVSVERQKSINAKRSQVPPFRDVSSIILKKSKSLLSQYQVTPSKGLFLTSKSDQTDEIEDESISLTVTSPPFLDVVNYEADNWLRCWFIGVHPADVEISVHRKIEDWESFTSKTLTELCRITKPGGHIAYEVGEVRNGKIKLEEHVIAAADGLPIETAGVMINQQDFTKTSNCWGVSNNSSGTNTNRIVLFRKK